MTLLNLTPNHSVTIKAVEKVGFKVINGVPTCTIEFITGEPWVICNQNGITAFKSWMEHLLNKVHLTQFKIPNNLVIKIQNYKLTH